jgi:hypothetical protein
VPLGPIAKGTGALASAIGTSNASDPVARGAWAIHDPIANAASNDAGRAVAESPALATLGAVFGALGEWDKAKGRDVSAAAVAADTVVGAGAEVFPLGAAGPMDAIVGVVNGIVEAVIPDSETHNDQGELTPSGVVKGTVGAVASAMPTEFLKGAYTASIDTVDAAVDGDVAAQHDRNLEALRGPRSGRRNGGGLHRRRDHRRSGSAERRVR